MVDPPADITLDQICELSEESFGYQQLEKGNNIAKERSRRGGAGSRKSTDTEEEWSIASPRNTALNLVASRALSYNWRLKAAWVDPNSVV